VLKSKRLKFAVFGAGFWSRYQLAAWKELDAADCVAICDPNSERANALAAAMAIPRVYTDARELISNEEIDFVDIITTPETHSGLVKIAAEGRVDVLCQKPIANSLAEAQEMIATCAKADVSLYIHENWRWQTPIRELSRSLVSGIIGQPVRGRVQFITAFDDYVNQPFLKEIDKLVLTDMGTHILDTVRFLFGEVKGLYCHTRQVQADLKGEDMATLLLKTVNDVTVTCEIALARIPMENDVFPQTLIYVECDKGSIELASNFWIRTTTSDGTNSRRFPPIVYSWVDPQYVVVQSSMVPCLANLLAGLRGETNVETTATDNLKTLQLVYSAYESAIRDEVIHFD
jgi:predicted dehydrogenase